MPSNKPSFHTVGEEYKGFKVTKVTDLHELHCHLIELTHKPSGASIMHIENDDPENLFCLSFQTIPTTSDGVAHILEHTVLCGSKNFPVKDPFFSMQRRSLNTFMNALTGSDFTCYPAATQVPKDFYNILKVYIDAVFHPILDERSFMQEGHRLEFAIPDDPQSPLEYKGIVFNEMKGALSAPTTRLNEIMNTALFPNLTYGINSGGDPKDIPSLTHMQLCNFHKEFYHPSRCLFFFYGNMPLKDHLDFIYDNILKDVKPVTPLQPIPPQPRFKEPKRLVKTYPFAQDEEEELQSLVGFGWLTCSVLEQQDLLALSIIEIVLMDTDASPLKKALLKSGLCKQTLCYMDGEISEIPLILMLKGCRAESADAAEKLIMDTLKSIVKNGVPHTAIDNAMHQLEIHRSEITGDHAPFGLSLFMRSALMKQHGGNPENGLKIHSLFDEVRASQKKNPHYFEDLIEKYLINNPHFVRATLVPDKALAAKEVDDEKAILAAIKAKLTPKESTAIVEKAAALATFQRRQEEVGPDILPMLHLDDVPRAARDFPLQREEAGNLTVFTHDCFTNGIVYADIIFDLPDIPEEDLTYARLLTTIISQVGCNGRTYSENLEYMQANTGGVGASMTFNLQAADHNKFSPSLYLRGKALYSKADKLFTLLGEMASGVDFNDVERLKELILKQYSALHSSLNQNALKYAVNLSASGLDVASKIANKWYGMEYYWAIEKLAKNFDDHAESFVEKLNELKSLMLGVGQPHLLITCDNEMYQKIKQADFYGLKSLQTRPYKPWKGNYAVEAHPSEGRIITSPVAFIGKTLQTVSYTHPNAPALSIAAFLLENLSLHTTLREVGGAYGGGATNSPMSATFYFYSYRDPNILSSLAAFDKALVEISKGDFDDQDLEEAKLELVQAMDMPVSPGSRGDLAYGWMREGKPLAVRQAFRDRALSLTKDDVIRAIKEHIIPKMPSASTVVYAGKELLEKENAKLIAQGKTPFPLENV